jgi:hypothetical protein
MKSIRLCPGAGDMKAEKEILFIPAILSTISPRVSSPRVNEAAHWAARPWMSTEPNQS